jgi:hypothetical protein
MAAGVILIVIGAIFAFAVRADTKAVDLQTMGWILMAGGAAIIYLARRSSGRLHETTVVDDLSDPDRPVHSVREYFSDEQPAAGPIASLDSPADHPHPPPKD